MSRIRRSLRSGTLTGAFREHVIDMPAGCKGNPLAFSADMMARAAAVPTRLTKFCKETRQLLVRAGYAHTEAALAVSRVRIPNSCAPSFEGLPDVG
jgi:hypothetical protein